MNDNLTPNDRQWYVNVIEGRKANRQFDLEQIEWYKRGLAEFESRIPYDDEAIAQAEQWLAEFDRAGGDLVKVAFASAEAQELMDGAE